MYKKRATGKRARRGADRRRQFKYGEVERRQQRAKNVYEKNKRKRPKMHERLY